MNADIQTQSNPLRIVTFNNFPAAFDMVRQWVERAGHTIVLAVTSPGPKTRRSEGYKQIAAMAGEQNIEVLITTRLKTVATPIIHNLKPDLIVSFTFPWLIPAELRQTARLGAVNLHPSVLPAYRGPNPLRQIYEAAPSIGATLHWMDDNFDTGRILSRPIVPLPRPCTFEAVQAAWFPTMTAALEEGITRAITGDPGQLQSETGASYGAAFNETEHWLDFTEPAFALQCKVTALNYFGTFQAKAHITGRDWLIERLDLVDGESANGVPGTIIEQLADGLIVQAGDDAVKIKAAPFSDAASV